MVRIPATAARTSRPPTMVPMTTSITTAAAAPPPRGGGARPRDEEADAIADRVLVLQRGRLPADGTVAGIKAG